MNVHELRESRLSLVDGVAEPSHQRPAVRNVLSLALRADYQDAIELIECDASIRALIITGSRGSFCSGGDIKDMLSRLNTDQAALPVASSTRQRLQTAHRVWLDRLRSLDVPVLAAVDGPAMGAGLSLALMADFVLASTRAVFCCSFAKVGAVPDFGAFYTLPRVVGLARAKELMMSARRFGPKEAKRLGIVHSVHASEHLLPEAHRLARGLAAGPPQGLGIDKKSLNRSFDVDYQTMAEIEGHQQAVALSLPYHAMAVSRFVKKEPALFDWERDGAGAK